MSQQLVYLWMLLKMVKNKHKASSSNFSPMHSCFGDYFRVFDSDAERRKELEEIERQIKGVYACS